MCIRQYPKNTQKPTLQGRTKSTNRKVRTLVLYMPLKLQSAHWFFQKIFCKMKAPKNAGGFTMKSIYEKAGGTYTRQGDYELPNLKIPPEKEIEIGIWGQRYRQYLKRYHKIWYYNLLTSGTLNEHLAEVDQQAERMFQLLVSALSKQENVTERLKVNRPMEWVQKTNSIRNRAVEIVNNEWIYI